MFITRISYILRNTRDRNETATEYFAKKR